MSVYNNHIPFLTCGNTFYTSPLNRNWFLSFKLYDKTAFNSTHHEYCYGLFFLSCYAPWSILRLQQIVLGQPLSPYLPTKREATLITATLIQPGASYRVWWRLALCRACCLTSPHQTQQGNTKEGQLSFLFTMFSYKAVLGVIIITNCIFVSFFYTLCLWV